MKIINIQTTVIEAEEGKLLRKISTGRIAGKIVHLGYNYYELGFGLSEPVYELPEHYDEIDEFEGWEEVELIDQVQRLKRASELVAQNKAEINTLGLTGKQALDTPIEWFPIWGKDLKENDIVKKGIRFQYTDEYGNTKLYEVVQDHVVLANYFPSVNTLSLYRVVTEQEGLIDDPIPYVQGMMATKGCYYSENDVVYLCIESYDGSTAHMPSVLPRYFEVVVIEETPEVTEPTDTPTEEGGETTEGETTEIELGTLEHPIVWEGSGILENGKYYSDGGVIYLCNRDSENSVTYALSALVGLYVEAVA